MIRSSFFNSLAGDRKYNASRFAEYFNSFIGNGVFPSPTNGLQVISNDDMTVTVKAGKAWINGYIVINDDDYILAIDSADGLLNRIDRVVARLDTTDREIRLEVKKGTFASSPVVPILQRDADAYELGLADILISNGVVSIVTADITDLRNDIDLCGKVSTVVKSEFPSGIITMWSGLIANIPIGWALCNGDNGTPNLLDRFIMGATTDSTINKTGGANSVALTEAQMPSHNHTGNVETVGAHSHNISAYAGDGTHTKISRQNSGGTTVNTLSTGTAGAHGHTIPSSGSSQEHENRPAYYTLAFIMKV